MILFGPENVVADVVSMKLRTRTPFMKALKLPVASRVSSRSVRPPFVKTELVLVTVG